MAEPDRDSHADSSSSGTIRTTAGYPLMGKGLWESMSRVMVELNLRSRHA